jgi:hypothetical protein
MILLRKGELTTPLILAAGQSDTTSPSPRLTNAGFDILLGRIEVEVPFVIGGNDYSLVLFGDSGGKCHITVSSVSAEPTQIFRAHLQSTVLSPSKTTRRVVTIFQ